MTDGSIEVVVKGVALDEKTKSPIVILGNESGKVSFPVRVGPSEASAIIVEFENIKPALPLTYDIVSELFIRHRFRFELLELYDYRSDAFLARIRYRKGFRRFTMEVRPSDGIAIALRFGASIVVREPARIGAAKANFAFEADDDYLYLESGQMAAR
jgi:uncharacterized protein